MQEKVSSIMRAHIATTANNYDIHLFREFWTHIEEVSVYIDSLCHKIQGDIEKDGLRKILRILFSKHMSLQVRTHYDVMSILSMYGCF